MNRQTIQFLSISLFVMTLGWGIWSTVTYFGIPVHGRVLMEDSDQNYVNEECEDTEFWCRGIRALVPSVTHTFKRAEPFIWYAVLCAVVYGLFIGWQYFSTDSPHVRVSMKPWQIYAMFAALLWLLFSIITAEDVQQGSTKASFRRVIEPHPSIYTEVEEEAMIALQDNFKRLKDMNCLIPVREIAPNIGEYKMKTLCVQRFFLARVVTQMLFLSLLFLLFLTTGRVIMQLAKLQPSSLSIEAIVSICIGICAWIVILWCITLMGMLTTTVGWTLIVLTFLAGYKQARYWLLNFFFYSWNVERKWYDLGILCAWLLITYLAFNFITVIRPFPIGWDDLGSYLNRPRLLVSYGSFIHSMSTFQWEYITSLGFLLYGYDSLQGGTAAMVINWGSGLLAVLSIVVFTATFLGRGTGALAGLLYYTLPLVGHFSFADMKTDNALFFIQSVSIFCLFIYLFALGDEEHSKRDRYIWLVLAGVLCGFAFGTKITAAMVLMALGVILMGTKLHWSAGIGTMLLAIVAFTLKGLNVGNLADKLGSNVSKSAIIGSCLVAAILFYGYSAWKTPDKIRNSLTAAAIVIAGFVCAILPWLQHNTMLRGGILPAFTLTAPNTLSPTFVTDKNLESTAPKNARGLPANLQIDRTHAACISTARSEELDRYWGYGKGWSHYLTLPWRTVMNIDSAGYYVTTSPVLLLFPLLLLMPFFWLDKGKWLRWLWIGTGFLVVEWMFLANGVPWYGIGMFFGLCIGAEALIRKAPDTMNRVLASTLVFLGLVSCFGMRFWQFESQKNLLEYPMGKASAITMRERTIPYYDDIRDVVLDRHDSMPQRPYLYRIGTFIPYFIPKNLEVIGNADHQLTFFNCLHQERDNKKTLERLKALGFNSIVFDTNTATIEKDPNGTLHKKVAAFVDWVNDTSLGLQVVLNKPKSGIVFILLP